MNSIYKKKRLLIFFLFFIFFNITYISNSYSQSSVAVLDVLTMLKDSSAAKSMKEQLDKTAKQYTDEEKKQAKEIQKKEEELLRQKKNFNARSFLRQKKYF